MSSVVVKKEDGEGTANPVVRDEKAENVGAAGAETAEPENDAGAEKSKGKDRSQEEVFWEHIWPKLEEAGWAKVISNAAQVSPLQELL